MSEVDDGENGKPPPTVRYLFMPHSPVEVFSKPESAL